MNLTRFSGYRATLYTSLSVDHCRERLHTEFVDRNGRWWRSQSDKDVLGWPSRLGFMLSLRWRYEPHVPGLQKIDTSRAFQFQLRVGADGTIIEGIYGYVDATTLLAGLIFALLFGSIIGFCLLALGIVFLIQRHIISWPLFLGAGILVICGVVLFDRSEESFIGERDYLVKYLQHVLDASPLYLGSSPLPSKVATVNKP